MTVHPRVLVLGATGRTGGRVLTQLLACGVPASVIVRSADRLPPGSAVNPLLEVVEADLLALSPAALSEHLAGCGTVISCLGHTINLRGILGPPHDLVTRAVRMVRSAAQARPPEQPLRLILMSSVSVHQAGSADRGRGTRAFMWAMRAVVPPARDNQLAADLLAHEVCGADTRLQWVVVRPDTLTDGDLAAYAVHDALISSLFRPDSTRRACVAHFMCELATDDAIWERWRGRMPVIVDSSPAAGPHPEPTHR